MWLQIFHQSGEDGAISTLRASTDPSLTGQGFKYFGPWYKGPLQMHVGNESKLPFNVACSSKCLHVRAVFSRSAWSNAHTFSLAIVPAVYVACSCGSLHIAMTAQHAKRSWLAGDNGL